ncbi:hypothetical protein V5738_15260 [Salinisphaera sp. SPP-AMP-43]|uniref:hypothetical protein n=1 Tax=Salinisphaera sp. SPP-AMP-43 TaxID=3121288 RepID=UPI003C6E4309
MSDTRYPRTPDGRYFVAKNRLWRQTDPRLEDAERQQWVSALMAARRAVRDADSDTARTRAREQVQEAKVALGERGPVWWSDGAADETQRAPAHSSYADWWAELSAEQRRAGGA